VFIRSQNDGDGCTVMLFVKFLLFCYFRETLVNYQLLNLLTQAQSMAHTLTMELRSRAECSRIPHWF